jgi:hypothetical protein
MLKGKAVCSRNKKAEEQKSSENRQEAFTRRNATHNPSDIVFLSNRLPTMRAV